MASRTELLQSIRPGMSLTKEFFRKIYGYELTWPGFADVAIQRLELIAGCSRAREHYTGVVAEWEYRHDAELKKAAEWYRKELEKEAENKKRKVVNESRRMQQNIQNLTRSELTELCQKLLSEGVITEPEQFVTLAGQGL